MLVPLTRGHVAQIDDADGPTVAPYRWRAALSCGIWYAVTGKRGLSMHRLLLDAQPGQIVDHINHDGLDNRRANLRICTNSQNIANCRMHRDNSVGFKGVRRNGRRYQAQIGVDYHRKVIGSYATAEEAARAYDLAATLVFGEFARLNFHDTTETAS